MSDTNRHTGRRSAHSAPRAPIQAESVTSPARVEALRKLVAMGQYQVSPRWIATRIFRAAGVKMPE
jgi:anti-sigma28 factor (negative regulator of flagellin synthesis)